MNRLRKVGLILILVGTGVILFALYAMQRLGNVKENLDKSSHLFEKNPFAGIVQTAVQSKVNQYDALIMGALIGGGILLLIGLWALIFGKKKHR